MATRMYRLHEIIQTTDLSSSWSAGKFTCASCRKRFSAYKLETGLGSVCTACVEKELKRSSHQENLLVWPISRFHTALSEQGGIQERLTVLWHFHHVIRYTEAKNAKEKPALLRLLVTNLGYIQPHPLAQVVRQAAYQACVTIGKPIIPLLLEMCQPTPWEFYANIVMTAGQIAPHDPDVQALLRQAAKDAHPEIRSRAQAAFLESPPEPTDKATLLSSVLRKLDPALRQFVKVGMEEHPADERRTPAFETKPAAKQALTYLAGQKDIENMLYQSYSADALRKTYLCHIQELLNPDEFSDLKIPLNKLKKETIAWAVSRVYADEVLFKRFLAGLAEELRTMVKMLVWEHQEYEVALLEDLFQKEILKSVGSGYGYSSASQDVHPQYNLFLIRREYRYAGFGMKNPYTYYFYLPEQLKTIFKRHLPAPPDYTLTPVETIPEQLLVYENRDRILVQLPLFYSYLDQGQLKRSKTGKLLKNSIVQMAKACRIEEFYDPSLKDAAYLKTRLLLEACQAIRPQQPVESSPASLKEVFRLFFGQPASYKLCNLLWHLQGVRSAAYYNSKEEITVRTALRTLLQTLPVNQWFGVEHLAQYCTYHDLSLAIVSRASAGQSLFLIKKGAYYYDSHTPVTGGIYKDALLVPFLKAVMFLLAAFGVVDLAYRTPENSVLQLANKPYLSVFDGLLYVRLTPLGAYLTGQTATYEATVAIEHATLRLDDKRLFITLDGHDPLKTLILERMARKINDTCYQVTYQSFLTDCVSKADVERKIALFHEHIAAPPPIWQEFLDDVLTKINPLTPVTHMTVYRLSPGKELIGLIARDEELKQYLLKAEDYHIVIAAKNLPRVKKRLETFGYFIDNL